MKKLTQKELKQVVHYNPETGIFTRKITTQYNAQKGDIAGTNHGDGYLNFWVNGKCYSNSRLAWLYVYGYFPENMIDHINRIRNDNRICNLREVSPQCNNRNSSIYITNTSGIKGVYWYKKTGKWCVQIQTNRECKTLGYYKSFSEAVCLRLAAEQCLNWAGCDDNSPAYQYVQKMVKKKKYPKIII